MNATFLEDLVPGAVSEFGGLTVTKQAIVDFARQFDPQPFHLDDEAAKASPFGGLIASGWHTASLCMRMAVDHFLGPKSGSIGSPGIDELRWLKPVRPGDTLRVRVEVVDTTPSRSKPDRGTARLKYTVLNQNNDAVMTMVGLGMFLRRPAAP